VEYSTLGTGGQPMKAVMTANVIIKSVFAICVTVAAVYFNNSWILWWYMVVPFLGYSYESKPIKKGE
jgi:hypothetical protein